MRTSIGPRLLVFVLCCLANSALLAQIVPVEKMSSRHAGLGGLRGTVALDPQTGSDGHLGLAFSPSTARFYVTCQQPSVGTPHVLHEFLGGRNPVYLGSHAQSASNQASVWGHRDGCNDQIWLYFGDDTGVYSYDPTGSTLVERTGPISVLAANGVVTSTASWPLPVPGALGAARGLAFNPNGNSGNGSFFTADFGSDIIEFDIDGNLLNTITYNGSWSIYGLAYDTASGMLWANSSGDERAIVEIDPTTGVETGRRMPAVVRGSQGGLELVRGVGMTADFAASELVEVRQASPDALNRYRLDLYAGLSGRDEVTLQVGTGSGVSIGWTDERVRMQSGDTLNWRFFDHAGTKANIPALIMLGIGADAAPIGRTEGLPEFVLPHAASIPGNFGFTFILSDATGWGPIAGPTFQLGPATVGAPAASFPWGIAPPIGTELDLRMQAALVDPNVPGGYLATNDIAITLDDGRAAQAAPVGARVQARGSNNYPGVAGAPYWTVTNSAAGGESIVRVEFDFSRSSDPTAATTVFDYDQVMTDSLGGTTARFYCGNSLVPGNEGTYRGGSEMSTGLVFGPVNTFGATKRLTVPNDPAAWSGFASRFVAVGSTPHLDFRFSRFGPGDTFAFDCDTDSGAGVNGGAMAGLFVRISWSSGVVTEGELAADPADPLTSFVDL